jgi:hypothetical protein
MHLLKMEESCPVAFVWVCFSDPQEVSEHQLAGPSFASGGCVVGNSIQGFFLAVVAAAPAAAASAAAAFFETTTAAVTRH